MPFIPVKRDRTSKPPIGTPLRTDGHWSTQGLIGVWALNEAGGSPVNLIQQKYAPTTAGTTTWNSGPGTLSVNNGAVDLGLVTPDKYTIISKASCASTTHMFLLSDQVAIPRIILRTVETASNNMYIYLGDNNYKYFSAPVGSFNTLRTWAFSVTGQGRFDINNAAAYLDGIAIPDGSLWNSGTPAPADYFGLGAYNILTITATFEFVLLYDKVLTPKQVESISISPWQIFESEVTWKWVEPIYVHSSYLPIKKDRTSKPPMGTPLRSDGHWSVQGLSAVIAINEGGGAVINAVNNNVHSVGDHTYKADSITFNFNGGIPIGKVVSQTGPLTYIASGRTRNLDGNSNQILIGYGDRATLRFYTQYGIHFFTSDLENWQSVNGVKEIIADTDYVLAGVHTGSENKAYVNGELCGSVAANPRGSATDWDTAIGGDVETTRVLDGEVNWALIYNIALTDSQVASLSINPWQIYEPEITWKYLGGINDILLTLLFNQAYN